MKVLHAVLLGMSAGLATVAGAAEFDGTQAVVCEPKEVHDCLPGESCKKAKAADTDAPKSVTIDFQKKEMLSPYRTYPLPIANVATTDDQLIVQGTDLKAAWTAIVFRKDGRLTVTVGDRKGAYVLFGQCTVKAPAP